MITAKKKSTMELLRDDVESLLRTERFPHVWCPGCGIGIVLNAFLRAMIRAKKEPNKTVVVSGIGCTGRAAGYVNMDSFHTTHGRAIPFAVGIKFARPELNVVVFSGDGDLFAIGGNHFINAARRNHDILVIAVNNFTYGMTGGQHGPTTPTGAYTTTTPYGNPDRPFNIPHLAISLGAPFVARWTTYHLMQLQNSIYTALNRKGFRVIEVISQCPTVYGRRNEMKSPLEMMEYFRKFSVRKDGATFDEMELTYNGKIVVGVFRDVQGIPTYEERYNEIIRRAQK
ncbi:MAG TPA: 2-oxoacid:ferredoxin oxidoreductase subunit beta [Candidatus Aciduliprofundum boonei]|uniref:2-oxoacid:ferredoxin oxidoreductase subunit beta n=1 Tax=Candidatus Aciduliprofundum boonei TaxID=379547 RepID=A0A7J3T8W6_9ARCH|nr:2-oxoacid:ferredoxin oxidoreductase subunit beta [Candidatus Aciduliprofundum boonei]